MPWTARVLAANVVDDAGIAVNERAIERFIAEMLAFGPAVERGLGHPNAVSAKGAPLSGIAPANEALASRRVIREAGHCALGRIVESLNVKCGEPAAPHRAVGLAV